MDYDLAGLGTKSFERLCQALAIKILGTDVQVFGSGPDGGREASFNGQLTYPDPSPNGPWSGYGILQAKFKEQLTGTGSDLAWLRRQVKAELEAWADPSKRRRRDGRPPQYMIFATNVSLSAVPGGGGKDKISALVAEYMDVIGLKDWRVWDGNQIKTFLDVHQDVAASFAALITPHALIASLREKVLQSTPPTPTTIKIGEGQPGCERAFRQAFEVAGGAARLGHPTGPAYELDPGFVQYLRTADGTQDSIICALNNRPAVVVSETVWEAISNLGHPAYGGGVVGAGFPSATAGSNSPYVGADLPLIELDGGQWGPGYLVRDESGRWMWRPQIRFDTMACRDRTIWTGVNADLRMRVAARIPWPAAALRLDSAGRRRVEAALAKACAAEVLQTVGRPRNITSGDLAWQKTSDSDGRNDSHGVSYQCGLNGPDGRPAITGRALFQLPTMPMESSALSLVDVRVDFAALRPDATNAAVPADLRITVPELASVFTAAWMVTTTVLPLAVTEDPTTVAPAGAPRLELYVVNERPDTAGGERTLRTDQLLDLTAFGTTTKTHLYDLAIGVTAPLDLTPAEIEATVMSAMVRMGEDYGFTDADRAF